MFLSVLSFFLGILTLQQCSTLPGLLLLVVLLALTLLSAFFKYKRITFFLCGFLFANLYADYYLSRQLSAELQAQEILLQGDVMGLPDYNKRRVRFDFKVTQSPVPLPEKLRLSWYYPE